MNPPVRTSPPDRRALEDLLQDIVLDAVQVVRGVDGAGIAVVAAHGRVAAVSNLLASVVDGAQHRLGEGPALSAVRQNTAVVLDLDGADRRWPLLQATVAAAGARTVLAVPIRLNGRPLGSLCVSSRARGAFSARVVREAELFVRPVGLRLSRAEASLGTGDVAEVAARERQDRTAVDQALAVLMSVHRDTSVERARARLEEAAADLGLDIASAAARIVAAPPLPGASASRA